MQNTHVAIIGGGLSGLSLAYFLHKRGISCTIIEQNETCGGVIQTQTIDGFTFECGPNTGVLGNIEIEQLFQELHPNCTLEIAQESAKIRLIWKRGKWNALPSGLYSALTTPLFRVYDKIRILLEPFRKPGTNPHETIYEMVLRRMGKSFHDYAVAPFINGVYAGNTKTLVTRFALAKLYALEQNYGSFIGGAIAKAKYNKKHAIPIPSKKVFSCTGGLQTFVDALVQTCNATIYTQCEQVAVEKLHQGYSVSFIQYNKTQSHSYSHVVTTCNSNAIVQVLPWLLQAQKDVFNQIEYAPVVQVAVGFKTWRGMKLNAFGGLVPPIEHRDILGVLFPSSMFTGRAPQGGALLSVFLGGMLRPNIIAKTDEEILSLVQGELQTMLQIPDWNPNLFKIFRYPHAIVQYTQHMEQVQATIQTIEQSHAKLYIAGSIRNGIGMADRVKQAFDIAGRI